MPAVVIRTKVGIMGIYAAKPEREKCEEIAAWLKKLIEEKPDARITLDTPGFGVGMPCPAGAITDVLVLNDGEQVPESWQDEHLREAKKFAGELAKVQNRPS